MNVLTNTNGCGLCRENEIKFYKAIPQLDRKIVQCRNCGLVFVHPMNGTFVTLDFEALEEREEKYHRMNVEAEREGKHGCRGSALPRSPPRGTDPSNEECGYLWL